jgi:CelD/BcsL family acetyltransferase involved in cellulose biosynthesis
LPTWSSHVDWRIAPYVDLEKLRDSGEGHLRSLSRNTREQLRRSLARYRERGELRVDVAATADEAEAMLAEMIRLHETRWKTRGSSGGFHGTLRRRFHAAFVREATAAGRVQMLRTSAGGETIGVLYNIVANGRVNFYQSGLRYEEQPHLKPGLVTHHLAIEHCLAAGMCEYDFLVSGPDDGRYKTSLARESRRLGWVQLRRPGWRRTYFDALRAVRDFVRSRPASADES